MLKPDQIGDLHLALPASTSGAFKLAIALIAPDDRVIAEAETLLEIAPAPVPARPVMAEASDATTSVGDGEAASSAVPQTLRAAARSPTRCNR